MKEKPLEFSFLHWEDLRISSDRSTIEIYVQI